MKNVFLFLSVLIVVSIGSFVAIAQQGKNMTPDARADMQTSHMKHELALADDQLAAVQAINLEFATKQKEVWDSGEKPYRDKMNSIMSEKAVALKAVLTAEQFAKWEAMKAEKQGEKHGRKGDGRHGNGRHGSGRH